MSTASAWGFEDFVAALPTERQPLVRQVWQLIRQAVPAGYTEHFGPKYLEFRAGPDMYVGLANQKGHLSLHLVPMYLKPALQDQLAAAAPKLNLVQRAAVAKVINKVNKVASKTSLTKKETASTSKLSGNIRTGIILLLVGLLVSLLGGISAIFGILGGIIAIIGVVLIILGLLDEI